MGEARRSQRDVPSVSKVLSVSHDSAANGLAVTMTKGRYAKALDGFWIVLKARYQEHLSVFWFRQDGAPPHASSIAIKRLESHFYNRMISPTIVLLWQGDSPDLTPLDFYIWG